MNQADKIDNIYSKLSRWEKIKWYLGTGDSLENLSKARIEREKDWYSKN